MSIHYYYFYNSECLDCHSWHSDHISTNVLGWNHLVIVKVSAGHSIARENYQQVTTWNRMLPLTNVGCLDEWSQV